MKILVLVVIGLGIGIVGWRVLSPVIFDSGDSQAFVIPQFTAVAQKGETAFDANCAECHGENATGTEKGPPLIHDFYNPGHHADGSFYLAVANGVRQHHWKFGNMPPQPQVSEAQTRTIIQYVRELQVANGIIYKPH